MNDGLEPDEISVFVRCPEQIDRAAAAVKHADLQNAVLDDGAREVEGSVTVATMHLAKGLEFRAVAVMAGD